MTGKLKVKGYHLKKYAQSYHEQGFAPIFMPVGEKNPGYEGWNATRYTAEDLAQIPDDYDANTGLLLGEPSDWRIDGDLDVPEAVPVADAFLPPTRASGRDGSPRSHRWFRSPGLKTKKWSGVEGETLVELRSTGSQTLVEPSVHPDGGRYQWYPDGLDPVEISPEELTEMFNKVATATLIARCLPPIGGRHDFAMALAGYMLRSGRLDKETTEKILLEAWGAVGADSDEAVKDIKGIVKDTYRKLDEGEEVVGGPTLDGIAPGVPKLLSKWWGWGRERQSPAPAPPALATPLTKPKLQEEAYHGLVGEIVRTMEPHTEADPAALMTNAFVSIGNAIGKGAYIRTEADFHHVKLYAAIVGRSSKGRKGTSWGYQKTMMRRADPSWDDSIVSGLSSGEGLINAVRDRSASEDSEDDESDSGVSGRCEDKRRLVMEPELAQALKVMKREGNTLSPVIREAWDDGPLQILTRKDPLKASRSHISIIGHITKDELRRHLTEVEMGNGFANRFLWVVVDRSKELPFGGNLDEAVLASLAERLKDAIEFGKSAGEILWGESAREIWREVYGPLSEGKPGLFGSVVGRAEAQVLRLAALYAVLDLSTTIEAEHLIAALAYWEYCEESARYIFGDALGDPVADRIYRALQSAGPKGMTRTDIRDLFKRNKSGGDIDRALNLLEELNLARRQAEGSGGRPAERWFVA